MKRLITIFLLYALTYTYSICQKQSVFTYEQISVENGLLRNSVKSICEDYLGYLWVGVNGGLHKYNGVEMKHYLSRAHNINKDAAIGDIIYFVMEDSLLNLWVGSDNGLAKYNREKDAFEKVEQNLSKAMFYSYCKISGSIVFATSKGLVFFDYETQQFELHDMNNILGQGSKLTGNNENRIYIGYGSRTFVYSRDKKKLITFNNDNSAAALLDSDNILWTYNEKHGIKWFDESGKQINHKINESFDSKKHPIQDIIEQNNKVWISTDGQGIIIYNKITDDIQLLQHKQGDANSLPSNSITDLYADDFGNILTGSVRSGVISINEVFITSYSEVPQGNDGGLSNPTVLALFEDKFNNIWIGTDGGGLNMLNTKDGTFEHFSQGKESKVVSICGFEEDKILISFYRSKIRVFDISKKKLLDEDAYPYISKISEEKWIPVQLNKDKSGNIWKFGVSLQILKPDRSIEDISKETGWKGEIPGRINDIEEFGDNKVIVAGVGGVYLLDPDKKEVNRLLNLSKIREGVGFNLNFANSLYKNENTLWVATSKGMFTIDLISREVTHYTNDLFRVANSVALGNDSSIWIGALNGLIRYYPENNIYRLYGKSDGVRFYEYINGDVLKSKDGSLYFGAVNGLIKIHNAQELSQKKDELLLAFDNIILDGISIVDKRESFLSENRIKLHHDNSSFKVDIIVNDEHFFRKRLYKYQLEGYSNEVYETTNPKIAFTHLNPGDYVLKAWCTNLDGSWFKNHIELSIFVPLPWWKQLWFIITVVCILTTIGITFRRSFLRQHRLNLELQLERERKEQEKLLNEQKFEFFANISHELRTPLSLIYGPLNRLVQNNSIQSDVFGQIKIMERQASKMKLLLDQILDIRKIDAGKDEINFVEIDLNNWLKSFLEQYQLELDSKDLKFATSIPEKSGINSDLDKLDKILSNLVSNAIKYSPLEGTIYIEVKDETDRLVFSVADEGEGVEESEVAFLFDRFFQAKKHKEGTGIGLAFAKELVNALEGEIWASNMPEGGALFEFFLPKKIEGKIKKEQHGKIVYKSPELQQQSNDYSLLKGKTVLIVEDDTDLRRFISDGLNQYCKVLQAKNGKEGWHMIMSHFPDIIVSDVMMPDMDGFELCTKLKEDVQVSHIPIILLTARGDAESRLEGYKRGADAYLSKPFSLDLLCVRIVNIITNRNVQKELFRLGQEVEPNALTYSNADEILLKKVVNIIHENLDDTTFDVNKLTSEVAMSRSGFYAKIKSLTNLGVNEFIKTIRINKAASLLKDTQMPIGEISVMVGYDNQRYFSTVFKEMQGCTPSQFRRSV